MPLTLTSDRLINLLSGARVMRVTSDVKKIVGLGVMYHLPA